MIILFTKLTNEVSTFSDVLKTVGNVDIDFVNVNSTLNFLNYVTSSYNFYYFW